MKGFARSRARETINLFHTVIHGSSHILGSDGSKRLVATDALRHGARHSGAGPEEYGTRAVWKRRSKHVEWFTRRRVRTGATTGTDVSSCGDAWSKEVEVVNQIADFTGVNQQLVGFGPRCFGHDLRLPAPVGFPWCVEKYEEVARSGSD